MKLEAKEEAITRGINANTIVIDNNLRYVKPFCFAEFPPVTLFPPMIMGMELRMSKLPCGADFVIYENPRREQEKIIKSCQKLAVKECADELKKYANALKHGPNEKEAFAVGFRIMKELLLDKIDDLVTDLYGTPCEACPDNNNAEYNKRTCPKKGECGKWKD